MSWSNATDSKEKTILDNSEGRPQILDKRTSVPCEGQVAKSAGIVTASGEMGNYNEYQHLIGGNALTLSDSNAKNFVGRTITVFCNTPAAGTTLTLTGTVRFNRSTDSVITFDAVNPSFVTLVFTMESDIVRITTLGNNAVVLS